MEFVPEPNGRRFGVMIKHPLDEVMAYVDWVEFLNTLGGTISVSEWLDVNDSPLILTGPMHSGGVAMVEVGGGDAGGAYVIENRVQFSEGGQISFRLNVYVKQGG